jgi:large subunit ribosomal protein L7/L12
MTVKQQNINIINSLRILSLLEIKEIVQQIENLFGIDKFMSLESANVKLNTQDKKEEIIEKTEFNLILEEVPADKKIAVLKVIRTLTNLGLKEVKELVESAPKIVKENLIKELAELGKKQIEEAGGKASLK